MAVQDDQSVACQHQSPTRRRLLWSLLGKLGLGRLPGDVVIERGDFRFYFPIVTCLGVSLVVSLILWLLNR